MGGRSLQKTLKPNAIVFAKGFKLLAIAMVPAKGLSGGRGIRTPGSREGTTVFKTAAIDHSAIPPLQK